MLTKTFNTFTKTFNTFTKAAGTLTKAAGTLTKAHKGVVIGVALAVGAGGTGLFAEDTWTVTQALDTIWLFMGAALVFVMQTGFAMLETGLTRAKNATNIVMKNLMDFCVGALVYWAVGWAFMYGQGNGFIGWSDFFRGPMDVTSANAGFYRDWLFQVVFCATASTIVSGAVSERAQFRSYLVYSLVISAVIYPISGHWIWNPSGWLARQGFHDFAGSTVVHSVGGWAALMGAAVLGPRIGKYIKGPNNQVSVQAFPGHSMPLAMLGVFILFFGWFGFNGASTLRTGLDLDPATGAATLWGIWSGANIARICVATCLAASAGATAALCVSWLWFKKPDASMTMNGCLAGLVAITAPCAVVSPGAAVVIGLIAGMLVVFAVEFIDKTLKIDDPVGASSVHLVNGIFGTIAVGIWGNAPSNGIVGLLHGGGLHQLGIQLLGVVSVGAWAAGTSLVLFLVIKATLGLRVSPKEELQGLDLSEHKSDSYAGFQIFSTM